VSKDVFVVFKQGVYRHECGGVFFTKGDAESAAATLLRGEPDDYHTYEVVPFCIGEITSQVVTPNRFDAHLHEPDSVCTFKRVGGVMTKQEK
jgi:hypothetical protein